MGDEEIKEASWVAQSVAGTSAYMHGINYDRKKFEEELESSIEHLKSVKR
ncbi:MAG: hypothetical protein M0Z58_02655 [Nitrospiraceae bacterium]|nr:hypothetical protein [Nitrospiraceae bacterium]